MYPWINKRNKRKGAFAASFLQDKTGEGGLMTTTGGLGTGALNFNLTPVAKDSSHSYNKYISVGFQLGYLQRRINQDLLNSGAQWTGSGFDPTLPIGEQILDDGLFNAQRSFAIYNFGALFYMADRCGRQKMYFGVNVQNLNQPNVAFFSEQNALPLLYVMSGGINFDLNHRVTLQPNIRWVKLRTSNEYRVGTLAYYNFDGGTGFFGEGNLGAGVWYDSNGSISLGTEVHQPKYFLGFSYDLGASASLQNLGNATWELSFGIKFRSKNKCLDVGRPLIEKIQDTTTVEVRTELGDSLYTIVATIQGKEVLETDTISVRFIPNAVSADLPTDEELKLFERKAFFYYLSD
ncbi:MAG: PorP/SprF family type IX secretion system membrane protein, partial [Bacteroidota bacterium]